MLKGYAADVRSEKSIAKAVAKLTYAFANANVPKVNVITGGSLRQCLCHNEFKGTRC